MKFSVEIFFQNFGNILGIFVFENSGNLPICFPLGIEVPLHAKIANTIQNSLFKSATKGPW